MSLLSNPQATPERVFAVLQLLRELGGTARAADLIDWMQPHGTKARSAIDAAISVSGDLRFISQDEGELSLRSDVPEDWDGFSDVVHKRLVACDPEDADCLLFEVMAFLVSLPPDELATTVTGCSAKECAGKINDRLSAGTSIDEGRRFNDTKLAPWVRWMTFLGLGHDGEEGCHFIPFIARRMERELRAAVPEGKSMPLEMMWSALIARMPYVDGGPIFMRVLPKKHAQRSDKFSFAASVAWAELQKRRVVKITTLGDSVGQLRLDDSVRQYSPFPSINAIEVLPQEVEL